MPALQIDLTDEEKAFLSEFLTTALKEARIEEHRTKTFSFRELVLRQENIISGLMKKLGAPTE